MLELIVLGEIPGTTIEIGFVQYLQLSFVISVVFLAFYEFKKKNSTNS